MYDHQTESLWLQVKRRAVTGPMTGAKLKRLPSTVTSWKKWRTKHPQTEVLSLATGYLRDYNNDPYEEYYESKKGLFSFLRPGPGAKEKELVIGVEMDGKARAYRLAMVRDRKEISDTINGRKIRVRFDPATDLVTVQDEEEQTVDHISTYWMVWKGIYPETKIYED